MKKAGHIPDTNFLLHNIKGEQKKDLRYSVPPQWDACHCIWVINASFGTPIWIVESILACGDCYSATKFLSKMVEKESSMRNPAIHVISRMVILAGIIDDFKWNNMIGTGSSCNKLIYITFYHQEPENRTEFIVQVKKIKLDVVHLLYLLQYLGVLHGQVTV